MEEKAVMEDLEELDQEDQEDQEVRFRLRTFARLTNILQE
jgi:hypothetical protein